MSILNRYIASHVIGSTAIVLLVLIGIESFMEFVTQLSSIGVGSYDVLTAFLYVPLQLPTDLYQLFPIAGFLGSLIGLGRLASSSQLIVMRAAGVSIFQIGWSVVKAALLMIVVVTIIGEWIAPAWQSKAVHLRTVAMGKSQKEAPLWLRRDNAYIHIGNVTGGSTMQDITRFDFDDDSRLVRITHAMQGKKTKGEWELYDVKQTLFNHDKILLKTLSSEPLGFMVEPELLKQENEDVDQESITSLLHGILYRKKTGLVTSEYQYALWKHVMQPITTIVMICLGIPFIFGSLRSSSMGLRVMIGVIIGFVFYMLNQFFGPITLVYQFPPLLAAALPTVLFLGVYVILLRRVT